MTTSMGDADAPATSRAADRLAGRTRDALDDIARSMPGGEQRDGQLEMAEAVARSIVEQRHLIVQAGTGTGKSFAYLVPVILSGRRTVIATATKTLQDQLAGKDLPFLADALDHPFTFAVLKGRSNYICLQRVRELDDESEQQALELGAKSVAEEIAALARWSSVTDTGDRAELQIEPSSRAWSAVSVGPRECPGAAKCPRGDECFTERARRRAAESDVIVVNTHLYGMHLATDGAVLPEHEVVVIDEAHQLEDTVSSTSGVEITSGRFTALARTVNTIIADTELVADLDELARLWRDALSDEIGQRIRSELAGEPLRVLDLARARMERAMTALRAIPDDAPIDTLAKKQRAMQATTSLIDDGDAVRRVGTGQVAWIEGSSEFPVLRLAPIDVGAMLDETMWSRATVVLTSATLSPTIDEQTGAPDDGFVRLDVESPFDYEQSSILYCAADLPPPSDTAFESLMHEELAALIEAAGGRTLALFTSHRALALAVDALRARLDLEILAQDDLPKARLIERFTDDPRTCLFATMGFWQGVDVPGATLSLVTIDKLPFPRPDDPLLQARRELARADGFRLVDLPRATTLLAQGAGRLIRTTSDRGVVAVFDSRMATKNYRWAFVNALPPMRRTRDRSEVEAFLRSLRSEAETIE